MQTLLSTSVNNRQYEEPAQWIKVLHTNHESLSLAVGIPETSLKRSERSRSDKVQTRLTDVHGILETVRPSFTSWDAAWLWFRSAPIPSFGNLSPSDVIKLYGNDGIAAIQDHVISKKLSTG